MISLREDFDLIDGGGDPAETIRHHSRVREVRALASIGNACVPRTLIECLPALEFICHYGAGYDGIDVEAANERHVLIANTPHANSSCVADFAAALLIASIRRMREADAGLRAGAWSREGNRFLFSSGLKGRKVGIYGLGAIGLKTAVRLSAFEMELGYHNRSPRGDVDYPYFDTVGALADWADDLVVTAAATSENRHVINRSLLKRLGPQGHFVNVARGSIVDEGELIASLSDGTIAGAGLDVYAHEPDLPGPLLALSNVVLAPHMASKTENALASLDRAFEENLRGFFRGDRVSLIKNNTTPHF